MLRCWNKAVSTAPQTPYQGFNVSAKTAKHPA